MPQRAEIVDSFDAEDDEGNRVTINVIEVVDETIEAGAYVLGMGRTRMMLGLREVEEVGGRLRIKDNGKPLWRR
jgi:hypothetical protein